MSHFYSYQREEIDLFSFSYTFITGRNVIYSVSIDSSEYQDLLDDYPTLLKNGFGFGFYHGPESNIEKSKYDGKIATTICKIIEDHFKLCGINSVLLYFCDTSDSRQKCRHVLFERWYKNCDHKDALVKEGVEVEMPDGENTRMYYLGYIANSKNEHIDEVKEEFERFSIQIIQNADK